MPYIIHDNIWLTVSCWQAGGGGLLLLMVRIYIFINQAYDLSVCLNIYTLNIENIFSDRFH